MYAQYGDIIFANLKGFNEFSKSGAAIYAEHKPIVGKPLLQATGFSLDEITLSVRLHVSYCNPAEELAQLKKYRDDNEILSLVTGNGKVEGPFVITSITDTVEDADSQGNIFSYLVNFTIREFVDIDPVKTIQNNNRDQAKAVGDKKPVAKKKKNTPTCPKQVSDLVTKIENHSKAINVIILEKGGTDSLKNRADVASSLDNIKKLSSDIIGKCDDPKSCAHSNTDLRYRAVQVYNESKNFTVALNSIFPIPSVADHNKILQACVRNLKTAALPLVKQSITGK